MEYREQRSAATMVQKHVRVGARAIYGAMMRNLSCRAVQPTVTMMILMVTLKMMLEV